MLQSTAFVEVALLPWLFPFSSQFGTSTIAFLVKSLYWTLFFRLVQFFIPVYFPVTRWRSTVPP